MAKGNLFLSQARGKVGSVVFSRVDGQQVTRVYTDQVKNPKSEAQNLQRAIFYSVQRMAAGAKYLVEQGQEGIATGYKSRRAFVKKALRDLRTAVLAGQPTILNVKGNPYIQALPVSLTGGSLPAPIYQYEEVNDDELLPGTPNGIGANTTMTLAEFFSSVPQLGLGKQLTLVWIEADNEEPDIADLNFRTSLHYSEVVFVNDEDALTKPAFAEVEGVLYFNPEVLQPSWGGTDPYPAIDPARGNVMEMSIYTIAFAYIVSDYTNNKWSRSYSPFVIKSTYAVDPYLVAATYAADASSVDSDLYLDQGDNSPVTNVDTPRSVSGNVGGLLGTSFNLTNVSAKTISVPVSQATEIDLDIYPKKNGYTADSVQVLFGGSARTWNGTVTLVPTTTGDAWTAVYTPTAAPAAGSTTIMEISVGNTTRTLNINWVAD